MSQAGSAKYLTYDANGNMTGDGARTFDWDASNQLLAVTFGAQRNEFRYDGLRRRSRIIKRDNGSIVHERRRIICALEACEERAADGVTVSRRLLRVGEEDTAAGNMFLALDHLASVTDVTDGGGIRLAHYDYGTWGQRTLVSGADVTDSGFTGYQLERESGIWLSPTRGYDPALARWLSEDPLRIGPTAPVIDPIRAVPVDPSESTWNSGVDDNGDPSPSSLSDGSPDGVNVYAYVRNQPTKLADPTGQWAWLVRIIVKKVVDQCKDIRCKPVRIDPPHHAFPMMGKRCHLQLDCWKKGIKNSHFAVRVPVPCAMKSYFGK